MLNGLIFTFIAMALVYALGWALARDVRRPRRRHWRTVTAPVPSAVGEIHALEAEGYRVAFIFPIEAASSYDVKHAGETKYRTPTRVFIAAYRETSR